MKILVSRNNSIGSYIIRLFTFSKWSHVAVLLAGGTVIHSTAKYGVHISSVEYFKSTHTWEEIDVDLPNPDEAVAFLYSQIGKPYDWGAIFGLAFQRDWQEDDKWFCSELWEAACVAAGRQRFRDEVSRITPQQSWAVK